MVTAKKPIQTFLSSCRTTGTGYAYRTGILRFLDFVYGPQMQGKTATKEEFTKYERLASRYLAENRDYGADLVAFIQKMKEDNTPPKSANIKICGVRQWLISHDVSFSDKQKQAMRRVKPKGGRRTDIKFADAQIIREIVAQGDIRLKSLALVLASSGIRIGEALALTWSNVHVPDRTKDKDKLTSLFIADSKTGLSRTAWITREAEEALLEWKKAIPKYLKTVTFKGKNIGIDKDQNDNRVFPYGTTAVYAMWDRACMASGHYTRDEITKRNQLNIHRLRGFFKTQSMQVIGPEYSELLMGHCDQYGNAYNGLPENKMAAEYQRCENALTIQTSHGVARVMVEQARDLDALTRENAGLKARLETIEQAQSAKQNIEDSVLFKQIMAAVEMKLKK